MDKMTSVTTDMFWISYHNQANDKQILEQLGSTLQSIYTKGSRENIQNPQLTFTPEKPRIGICSDYLCDHTIGKLNLGIIQTLKKNQIHVTIYRGPNAKNDETSACIDSLSDASIRLPESIETARKMILEHELDFMFYPDIGMSPYTYTLALKRLAPIQATSWGHPNTTGLNTIDYFLSSDSIEPDDSKDSIQSSS